MRKSFISPKKLLDVLIISDNDPDVIRGQYHANAARIPVLYFLGLINAWTLVFAFYNSAPELLTIYIPAVLTALVLTRMYYWHVSRSEIPDPQTALKALRKTNVFATVFSALFALWALSFLPYGGDKEHGYIAFYCGTSVVGCVLCLMHVKPAANGVILVGVSALVIAAIYSSGETLEVAKAVNFALVAAAMAFMVRRSHHEFKALIKSRMRLIEQQQTLLERQAETQRLSDENFRLANQESLTGLANRRFFFRELDEILERDQISGGDVVMGVLDLNDFKGINDSHGHLVGDKLLQEVASRLSSVCPEDALLARLGGDEYGIVLRQNMTDDELLAFGDRVIAALEEQICFPEATLEVSASIGLARKVEDEITGDDLYERADYALYQSKRSGGAVNVTLYSPQHALEVFRKGQLERTIRSGALDREVFSVFQPVVDINTEEVVAFEALARWNSPEYGTVPPSLFIPIAERIGVIDRVTTVLFDQALEALSNWPQEVRLSFNLSARTVTSQRYAESLIERIRLSGIDPSRIDFEITETAMVRDFEQVFATITMLKAGGVGISLDDFGTGYSSLKHLHRLPLDKIKIDRSFVANIRTNPVSYKIVKSLLALSREMNISCVVEGVETASELSVVHDLGGTMVQGYYYSKPVPADEAIRFLTRNVSNGQESILPATMA